jgi:carboxymethylenebutenolidase
MSEAKKLIVTSDDGKTFDALTFNPTGAKKAPAIVLIQEIFGVNNALRVAAGDFANSGFLVAVPDLFWRLERGVDLGYGDDDRKKAMALMGQFNISRGVADIGATVDAVRKLPECNGKVAVVGYCLGGTLAFLAGAHTKADAVVCYYGTAIHSNLGIIKNIDVPMLLHFAEKDNFVPPEAVAQIKAALGGTKADIHLYPDVGHAFSNVDRQGVYNPKSALLANSRTVEFLSTLQ